jgi:hypothetical protein
LIIVGGGRKEINRTVGQILNGCRSGVSDVGRLCVGLGGYPIVDTVTGDIWFGIGVPAEGNGGALSVGSQCCTKNKRG